MEALKRACGNSADLVVRETAVGEEPGRRAAIAFFDGLVDQKVLSDNILRPLSAFRPWTEHLRPSPLDVFRALRDRYVPVGRVTELDDLHKVISHIALGNCVQFVDGVGRALAWNARGWAERAVEEPESEPVVRGPRDGFTETLRTNTSHIRRRIRDASLRIEEMEVGGLTRTTVAVLYIESVVDPGVLQELETRLGRINVDGILESGYLEEFIEDSPWSPFPQVLRTERPDRVAAALLEGRIAILTDGAPLALIVPAGFTSFISANEDYYERSLVGSFQRLLRYGAFLVALVLPSLYVAVTTFHHELLPTQLILHIAAQHEGIPFPTFVEALLLEIAFDVIREATVRLPRMIGQTITIVGILVVGQSAVQAGLVSPFMVIIVAFTGIASFAVPIFGFGLSVRVVRYGIILLAAGFGLFGILFALSLLLIHFSSLRSFGQPYLAPLAPVVAEELRDTLIRVPWWAMETRPRVASRKNLRRRPSASRTAEPTPATKPGPSGPGKEPAS